MYLLGNIPNKIQSGFCRYCKKYEVINDTSWCSINCRDSWLELYENKLVTIKSIFKFEPDFNPKGPEIIRNTRPTDMVTIKCIGCGTIFDKPRRDTFLNKTPKRNTKFTACSQSCAGKLRRRMQLKEPIDAAKSIVRQWKSKAGDVV